MEVLVIDNLEPRDAAFNDPLRESVATFASVQSVSYRDVPPLGILNERYDAIIISGAPLHYANDVIDSRLPFLDWVLETTVPVLGICLGHQNLARLFGGQMIVDKEAEKGTYPLVVLHDDPLLAGVKTGDKIEEMHRVSVTLPIEFQQLASTEACHNQVMKHKTKPFYGVQFHPELSSAGHDILCSFMRLAASYAHTSQTEDDRTSGVV